MQNKGLVRLFAVLFGLVSIYQLSFTFKANQLEDEAKIFAESKFQDPDAINDEEIRYIDSIANKDVYDIGIASFTGKEVKEKAMNLGLDLKGGLNVILQISVRDILEGLSNNSKDPAFNKALADAEEIQKNAQESYLESFFTAWDAVKGDQKLASPDIFANRDLDDVIDISMSDADVKQKLEEKVDESIVSAFEVLRKRIDQFGVVSPNIQRLGNSGRVLVELPGVKDVKRATELITQTAQLQFWDVEKPQTLGNFFTLANEVLKDKLGVNEQEEAAEVQDSTDTDSTIDDLLGETSTDSTATAVNPIFDLIAPVQSFGLFAIEAEDKETMEEYLSMPEVRANLPAELRYTMFAFGLPTLDDETGLETVDVYALKGNRDNVPELSGGVITDARQSYGNTNKPTVTMQMNAKGSKIWEEMTGRANQNQSQIAIVLDDIVYSAPTATRGAISGGNTEISGNFTVNEAVDLANVLRAGKLPARAEIVQAEQVGASLGQEAIESGTKSFLIALSLVLIWMVLYYGRAGIFADIALLLNILLIFGVLSGLGAVLTLPGLAGIVLTIGMSVDANVLIFERVREELAKGKGMKEAVKDGFANALSSILDANITTGLTAIILFVFGTGPIKGFATTLLIGIMTSLFTAIFITRLLVDWYVNKGKNLDFSTSITKNLFKNMKINFISKRKVAYVISGILLAVCIGSLVTNKLDQGIDFVGGRTYQVRFTEPVSSEAVAKDLTAVFESVEVKTIGSANQLKISTKYKVNENSVEVDEEVQTLLFEGLKSYLPQDLSYDDFSEGKNNVGKVFSGKVSPTIADDIKNESFLAVLGSLIVVFLYILFRFRRWQFSLGAVAAVFHDVIIVLGIFSLLYKFMPFSMEIDQAFIAAILTVIGYSLNDTVVVFDRIREVLLERSGFKGGVNINSAINSTLSRTLNTSLTTLVVLLAMFIFGAESLRGLLFALIVGVVVGTYSSVFIATPLMFDTLKNKGIAPPKEEEEEK
ncbi:protein translocase subunit SecDF [Psychroserpens sp.]|uniref:protein translocase subunit SecDF n=1 Tax=Psychroserpens sp. TaxID=2020870 RepID=UPI001B25D85D|nr:protein translocase subunit SecDF [Psychroserpens sp.]MBO6608059.1 protein translocase subunit SecDF [Psychroserpens sp.]MBO6655169.1 protein translocase subunit SecDF [Psychroserpens sp.]MBO6683269.1 protein translocase subunit SecDF [Psychroserpens sp.]MBO6751432.1 protein translocase subunit SecDF [Psychroserpens sp.]MBO6916758.1 protein translocase subunit SecDF [Psychroserpens sp.]